MTLADDNTRPAFDNVIRSITEYVYDYEITSDLAWERARIALLDSLACAIEGVPSCSSFIGPIIKGTVVPNGFPLPGTSHVLDPMKAAFDLGACIRYLDHSDAFPGAEWGHPSDNIGAILPIADWLSREGHDISMKDVLEAIIKAYEIEGCFQIKNAFNKVGIDHVILVKIAATAVLSKLVGLTRDQADDAVSQAFADGQPLRVYRQSPNTSPRKGWAGGDACMRAVHLVLMTKSGQPGYPTVLTAKPWGFYDVCFGGKEFSLPVPFGSMVIENYFIKLVPAEGHGIAGLEAAVTLSKTLKGRLDKVRSIKIRTQEAAMTIINKTGPLHNPADRDHCMQYMVAVALLKEDWLVPQDYENDSPWASDPRVDVLRNKMTMEEDPQMTKDYHNPKVRKGASGLTATMEDGEVLEEVLVERPLGHPWRPETFVAVKEKFCKLSTPVLSDPEAVWNSFVQTDPTTIKVHTWVEKFSLKN
ncbi:putative 2-methylcitrate dehydratase [Crucibulum laeve]|uniref:Putative 2-methylcitrate dehydratase n=1 Tax=Crucibulum laeve TaxID=68775 RepID=A0A5C3LLN9_9AGAR|nr:putative 2-methylcitrate dehydratase [Crucibulum laeve]